MRPTWVHHWTDRIFAGEENLAALFKVPMIPVNALQNSTSLTFKIVVSTDVTNGSTDFVSDMMYGVSDGISSVGFDIVHKK